MNIFNFNPNKKRKFEFDYTKPVEKPPKEIYPSVSDNVSINLKMIKEYFNTDINSDIKLREFKTGGKKAFAVFVENLVDSDILNTNVLAPLMLLPNKKISFEIIMDSLIVNNQMSSEREYKEIINSINMGDCCIFVDEIDKCIVCDVKSWAKRGIDAPISEAVIYGPHEGFNENYKTNIALIRKTVRNENLICETVNLGKISKTPCALMYMNNLINPELLKEIKYRLKNIDVDYILQAGELEQFIEDSPFSLTPQMLTTERPDKASTSLIEGKIVLILQGSPFALVLPVTISEFLTTVEDNYIRFPFAVLMKFIRIIGIISSFLLSGIYIAITNFHQEVLPTNLLFAIEASREAVPFSAFWELLIMELAFDIIREASIRVPSPIGSTLGIIGGLIVGQAAVSANLVSPIAIIIVSLTGIGSFATPNYALNFTFRFSRYIYIIMGAIAGFFGIAAVLFVNACMLCAVNSLGVPLFNSMANDKTDNIISFLFPVPIWKREFRHNFANAKLKRVQENISRKWDIKEQ